MNDELELAHLLADAAGAIIQAGYTPGVTIAHQLKDDGTPVSQTDREVEEELLGLVREHRPQDAFIGEEVGAHGTARRRWVVGGIDGTTNFVRGEPLWGTLVALVEDDLPVLGMHSSPAQQRRSWATKGGGAWTARHDAPGDGTARRLRVAAAPSGRPRVNIELAWEGHPTRPTVERLLGKVDLVSMTTHPALMVAGGEIDLAAQVAGGPWDFAAVMAIVQEAGGRCVDLHGQPACAPAPPILHLGAIGPAELRRLLES